MKIKEIKWVNDEERWEAYNNYIFQIINSQRTIWEKGQFQDCERLHSIETYAFGDYPYKSANYSVALSINKAFSALSNSAVLNFIRLQTQMIFSSKACEHKLMKQ